ncbi:MAG TPA: Ger(x)C family spore germination protein [Oscillospiraceae bacterium]|nr:Ger(x)C family spore germination protein [Oscillospiraceae bacterium]HPF55112.1 Ger(x)C family spore germination protein [Clostridiales bacterium]HPK34570.1 Ger(x)C family spore germination protein [Oscillospiraceae bacterium]HPR76747.1 Ger(x)C family spore germination protein [Oscillospiraceae bacterium]
MKKARKALCVLVVILMLSVFLSGCAGDFKDINEKSIFTAVALDKKGDEFYFYVEIANIEGSSNSENKSGGSNKYITVTSHGKTITEARENMDRQLDNEVHLSAVRALILTENFAKEHLVEYLNRLRADEAYRKKTITVITQEDPENLFQICNQNNVSVGFYTEKVLKSLEENGETFTRTTTRLLENLSAEYTGILISCIGLQDQNISLKGYSVVNDSTIVGFIPVEEAKSVVFIKADKPGFDYVLSYKTNQFTIEVILKKKKIKPSYENGEINFDMAFDFEAKLMYGDEKTPYLFTQTDNANLTRSLTEMLKTGLIDAVGQAQKTFQCDYLQFDDIFRIKYPSQFDEMDWQNEFEKVTYSVDVTVVLNKNGVMDYETDEQK